MDAPQRCEFRERNTVGFQISFGSPPRVKHGWARKLQLVSFLVLLAFGSVTVVLLSGNHNASRDRGIAAKGFDGNHKQASGARPLSALPPTRTRGNLTEAYARLPLSFETNQGQVPDDVQFISRGSGYTFFLTKDGVVVGLRPAKSPSRSLIEHKELSAVQVPHMPSGNAPLETGDSRRIDEQGLGTVRLRLVGIDPAVRAVGKDPATSRINYYLGQEASKWRTGILNYSRVIYSGVFPGVDLIYYGNQRRLEHDFVLTPGADLDQIVWEIQGPPNLIPAISVDSQKNLLVRMGDNPLRFNKPIVYEVSSYEEGREGGSRRFLEASYTLKGKSQFGFRVIGRDPSKTLVIDPVLEYSTYLGGGADDMGNGVAVDSNGDAYVTGETFSTNFPTANAAQSTCKSCSIASPAPDVFVTKFNAAGSIVYSTYLGGSAADIGNGIAVDGLGEVYVTGSTSSSDFPTTPDAHQMSCKSCSSSASDAFVVRLDPTGKLSYSTYLGGGKSDVGLAIAADSNGSAYITGSTASTDFPTLNPLPAPNDHLQGTQNAFVSVIDHNGVLLNSTYLGGSARDAGYGIAADASGIYVAGQTSSNNFPILKAYQSAFKGTASAFVSKLSLDGAGLVYSTYLGGTGNDGALALAIDSTGNAYVTGTTTSADFPSTPGAFQTSFAGGTSDAFVAKLNNLGSQLVYSTYLGGSLQDAGTGIAVDSSGNASVVGQTTSGDFPTAFPIQQVNNGNSDAFVTRLVPAGCASSFSTFLGGHSADAGTGIAVDHLGNAIVAGRTSSNDFPTSQPFQPSTGGGSDAFLAQLNAFIAPATCLSLNNFTFPGQALTTSSVPQTVTVTNGGNADLKITGVTTSGSFGETDTCVNSTVSAGANCTIDVTFSPAVTGRNAGSITITDNAGGSPQSIALLGVGTDFKVTASPSTASVNAGQSATFTLNISPLAGFNSTVTLACGDLPLDVTCNFSQTSVTLNGSSAASPTLTLTTTARSGLWPVQNPGPQFRHRYLRFYPIWLLYLAIFALLVQILRQQQLRHATSYFRLAPFICLLSLVVFSTSCGFNTSTPKGTPAANYPVALTATAGTLQHTIRVTLTVN